MRSHFYASARLGDTQATTPEGFLICGDVRIARTGDMLYGRGEIPVEAGPDGRIVIHRTEGEVFRAETIASFHGKSVTLAHPDEDVSPLNFRDYEVGTIQNPRRGDGLESDFLVADLLIKDPDAIEAIRGKKIRDVSCGYDADYEQVAPGRGFQRNIYGNHVAIVSSGRAGPRCSIGDQDMTTAAAKPSLLDKIAVGLGFKDAAELEGKIGDTAAPAPAGEAVKTVDAATLDASVSAAVTTALAPFAAQLKLQGDAILAIAKARTGDAEAEEETDEEKAKKVDKEKTKDAATVLAADFESFPARAEILAPGHKAPTHDAQAELPAMHARLHSAKVQVLTTAYATADGKAAIDPFLGGLVADFPKLAASTIDAAFIGASEIVKAKNNGTLAALAAGGVDLSKTADKRPLDVTPATLNKSHSEFWATRQPGGTA